MSNIDRVVDVTIQRGTIQVSRAGFGVPLILSTHTEFAGRIEYYGSLQEVVDAGFATTSDEYLTAQLLLSQRFQPPRFAIGRIDAGDATIADSLIAVQNESDDWYALILLDRTVSEVSGAAAWIETQKKIFLTATADSNAIDGTGDIIETLNGLNYTRTISLYNAAAATSYVEAAWAGRCLPLDPGSLTWKFKSLAGVVADGLTTGQIGTVDGKSGNTYTTIGGVDVTAEGVVASGEFIDVIRFQDFLQARIEENVYSALVNNEKIPYTQKGIAQVEQPLRAALLEGERVGGLASPDGELPAFTINVPDILAVSNADKIARELNNVTFTAYLAGAIHNVKINGTLSV